MMAIVVARGGPSGREGEGTRTLPRASRPCGAAPHTERAGRTSAIFVTGVVARARGMSGTGARNHGRHASIPSAASIPLGSAIRSEPLPATVIAGSLRPFWRGSRLFLNSVGPFQAARRLSALVKFCQEPASGFTKSFRSFSSVLLHVLKHGEGGVQGVGHFTQECG